jgi:hypothetical protein
LLEDALKFDMCCVVLGVQRDEDLVEVLPPALRGPFDNLNVIGRKDCYKYSPEQLVVAAQGLAVQLDLVSARNVYLGFDEKRPALSVRPCTQHRLLRAAPYERSCRRPAKAPESGEIAHRFKQVGLPGTIVALEQRHPLWRRLKLRRYIVAKIAYAQVL